MDEKKDLNNTTTENREKRLVALQDENDSLRLRLDILQKKYDAVVNSKGWRFVSFFTLKIDGIKKYIGSHSWTLKLYLVYREFKFRGLSGALHQLFPPKKAVPLGGAALTENNTAVLADIAPLEVTDKSIAVHLHLYYEDLLNEFFDYFSNIPYKFDLFVSCREDGNRDKIYKKFKGLKNVGNVEVACSQNRGRDIAPLYALFGDKIEKYDYFLHVHSKKSLHSGAELFDWRRNAMEYLTGSPERVKKIFSLFEGEEKVGVVCPETAEVMGAFASHWLRNTVGGKQLLDRMGIPFSAGYFSYPIGSFFWAKTDALRPIFDLKLRYEDFPEESGQIDGTTAHALERVVAFVCRNQGYNLAILDERDGVVRMNRTLKAFKPYFNCTVENVFEYMNRKEIVSFDIFDTLITRLVYNPDDVFALMERKIKQKYNLDLDYLALRKKAEEKANQKYGAYCNIHNIYEFVPNKRLGITAELAEEFKELEISIELDLCIPRKDMLRLYNMLKAAGKKIMLISDMYLTSDIIGKMLEKCGYSGWSEMWISCETGKRKDNDEMWKAYGEKYGTIPAIHAGDNAQSDVQAPGDLRLDGIFEGFLVLNPRDEFKLSKHYSVFSKYESTTVENSLILGAFVNGCLCNNAFDCDSDGEPKFGNAEKLGAGAFGALFTLFSNEIHRLAGENDLWFLAREGYLLKAVYDVFEQNAFGKNAKSEYFLTSRRSASVPALENAEDIEELLSQYYDGAFSNMLKARTGVEVKEGFADTHIVIPRDEKRVLKMTEPYFDEILNKAKTEKAEYLNYINSLEYKDNPCIVDVGYSGTIQYYLSKLTDKRIKGVYLSTTPNRKPERLGCVCHSLYPLDDADKKDENPVFKNQLFLEAVLKAPFGQLMYFKDGKPVYGEDNAVSDEIFEMQRGILKYASRISLMLNGIGEITIDKDLISNIVDTSLTGDWWKSGMSKMFDVTDDYCSNGNFVYDEGQKKWVVKNNNS